MTSNHFLVKQKNLHPPQPFSSFLKDRGEPRRLILSEDGGMILRDILAVRPAHPGDPKVPEMLILVGPEGGWTKDEEEQAVKTGFEAVSLGSRILRAETAALASLAAISIFWGD